MEENIKIESIKIDKEIKLQCVRLAVDSGIGSGALLDKAKEIYDFVMFEIKLT